MNRQKCTLEIALTMFALAFVVLMYGSGQRTASKREEAMQERLQEAAQERGRLIEEVENNTNALKTAAEERKKLLEMIEAMRKGALPDKEL